MNCSNECKKIEASPYIHKTQQSNPQISEIENPFPKIAHPPVTYFPSLPRPHSPLTPHQTMHPTSVLETCLYVDDLARAENFYRDVLGLVVESRQEGRHVFFHCGQQMLLLFNPLASREANDNFPAHGAFGPGHVAFAVSPSELPAWKDQLAQHAVPIEKIIDWPSGGKSLYFRDPAGNSLELATPNIWPPPKPKP